ncbi:spindle and kinetochore-associated protein 3 [Protopterus annectens]|uniref:spindle and kinetochore-associated protein 3 n=1 Tax=Protopterus annectens TaxID=7888 RepID=UPI001CFC31F0|nr:spindle and kinetochore-associated protein 3 [Protopterus annectens]
MEARDFFSKLRSLAITLDKESRQLEQALNNKECDEVTDTEAPLKVLHDMQSEVRALKGEVHAKLSDITLQRNEMNEFIKAAGILRKRAVVDIEKLKAHFQSYGYEAPILKKEIKSLPEEETKQQSIKSTRSVEDISNPEFENVRSFSSPSKKQTASWDSSGSPRTPQLADFGLSHYQFANPWEKLPALPGLSQFSYSGTHKNMLKPVEVKQTVTVPKTPKCTLRLEDEDFTPKLEDFGISENTMCLNADFTMELMKKNNELAKRCNILTSN